jgi:hypothetical protein
MSGQGQSTAAGIAPGGANLLDVFTFELKARAGQIASWLPKTLPVDRFINSVIQAVQKTPQLLDPERRTALHGEISKAAIDGLLPDGREGVLLPQNERIKPNNAPEYTAKIVRWQPMAWGIRKRARETDDIIIDTQVVCANDRFVWRQGDNPSIDHEPAPLGTLRGQKIGAYAIFKKAGDILHREVMDAGQIAAVRAMSRQPNGLMWTKFEEEGYRKSVLRRGSKSVPCSGELQTVINRWDDLFDLDAAQSDAAPVKANIVTLPPVTARAAPIQPPIQEKPVSTSHSTALPTAGPASEMPPATFPNALAAASLPSPQPEPASSATQGANGSGRHLLSTLDKEMGQARTKEAVQRVWDCYERDFEGRGREFMNAAQAAYERHTTRVKQGKAA